MWAMAGLAEAAMMFEILLSWLGWLVIGGLGVAAFATNRWELHLPTACLMLAAAVLLVPWEAPFFTPPPEYMDDPDYVHWHNQAIAVAVMWYIVTALVVLNLGQYCIRGFLAQKKLKNAVTAESSSPEDASQ